MRDSFRQNLTNPKERRLEGQALERGENGVPWSLTRAIALFGPTRGVLTKLRVLQEKTVLSTRAQSKIL